MKRIWRLAGVGLLMVTVGAQAVADERDNAPQDGPFDGMLHKLLLHHKVRYAS